jgi:cbb3-type cytochrome c oxidase subunit II
MKMTPALLVIGGLMVFWSAVIVSVILPAATMNNDKPSENWTPWNAELQRGNRLYVTNGCSYCHSQFVRTVDQDLGADRIAERGDYAGQEPIIVGVERTGPDLSEEGGEHPDDWHRAHFANPRTTRPMSLMPSWEFLGQADIETLTRYVQSRNGKAAQFRMDRQKDWQEQTMAAYQSGLDNNVEWIHSKVPQVWRQMANPYPAGEAELARGELVYQRYCINCHGEMGDGDGPAKKYFKDSPPPLNFTILRRHLVDNKYIGGIFYYQVMNGITGTAMPYFKRELESEKIWDVSNYLATRFLGYTDAGDRQGGIPASYEPPWKNTYQAPATQPAATQPAGKNN